MPKPFLITGIRGRNGNATPLTVPDDQCCEALNVDFWDGDLCRRRLGSVAPTITGVAFTNILDALVKFLPGEDDTLAELFAFDLSGVAKRIAAGSAWAAVTLADAIAGTVWNLTGVSLAGFLFVEYDSAVNRSHVWDGSTIRRRGLARTATPVVATNGGAGLSFTRFYRTRWVTISGSDTQRRSEPSTAASITITDDASVRISRPALAGEGETHWEVEYADSADGPWYVRTQIVVATTFYDDTDATIDDTLDLSPEDGINMPPPSFKYIAKGGGRLLQAGAWETVAGESFIPLQNEVYWTPVNGANDVGDLERQPPSYKVTLDHPVNGLSEAVNGIHYAFGFRGISALVPSQNPGEGAFQRITERTDIGCIRHHAILTADDELGNPCVYFLSHRGPYRITSHGMQYLGHDIEDIWETVQFSAAISAHGIYYADLHQIWWWVAPASVLSAPTIKLVFDTQLGRSVDGDTVIGGWSVHDGPSAEARASVMFSATLAAAMSHRLVPYIAQQSATTIWRCNSGTDDVGTDYQAYLDTKEYAPAGLGRNCSLSEPHLIGLADADALVSVTMRTDFGRREFPTGQVSLAPEFTETHVQRKLDGLQTAGIGTVRFRIGDSGAADPGFGTLDALVASYEPAEGR